MKTINIAYWVSTALIAGMMLFTGVTNAIVNDASVKLIATDMGYPPYIIGFLGVAKICGAIVILIPAFPRLKEWAYAGLFFDLLGAAYSSIKLGAGFTDMLFMAAFIIVLLISYFLHIKRLKAGKP